MIVIVGAGPTGLTTACALLGYGVEVTVIERRPTPSELTRAVVLWSGAQRVLHALGVLDAIAAQSVILRSARYENGGRTVTQMDLSAPVDHGLPLPLACTQPIIERQLRQQVLERGGRILMSHEVVDLVSGAGAVTVRTDQRSVQGDYLVGADGAHSAVRRLTGVGFIGSQYDEQFFLADGRLADTPAAGLLRRDQAVYRMSPKGTIVVVPLPYDEFRIFVSLPDGKGEALHLAGPDTVNRWLADCGVEGYRFETVRSASTFTVSKRRADHYRRGRVVLAGDAAHIHSPAGGQGMNTGIQDAHALAWRLAQSVGAPERYDTLIKDYERERRAVAERVIAMADRQTTLWSARSLPVQMLRDTLLRTASAATPVRRRLVETVAQIDPVIATSDGPAGVGSVLGRFDRSALTAAVDGFAPALTTVHQGKAYSGKAKVPIGLDVEHAMNRNGLTSIVVRPDYVIAEARRAGDGPPPFH